MKAGGECGPGRGLRGCRFLTSEGLRGGLSLSPRLPPPVPPRRAPPEGALRAAGGPRRGGAGPEGPPGAATAAGAGGGGSAGLWRPPAQIQTAAGGGAGRAGGEGGGRGGDKAPGPPAAAVCGITLSKRKSKRVLLEGRHRWPRGGCGGSVLGERRWPGAARRWWPPLGQGGWVGWAPEASPGLKHADFFCKGTR